MKFFSTYTPRIDSKFVKRWFVSLMADCKTLSEN